MLDQQAIFFMKSIPFFSGLPAADEERLYQLSSIHDYTKGDHVFLRGDKAQSFYIVMGGWVKLYRDTHEGDEAVLGLMTRTDIFGDMAIFNGEIHPFSAQVVENAKIISIPADILKSSTYSNPEIMTRIMQSFAQQMNRLQLENEHLSVMSAPQRVGCLLLQLSGGTERQSQTIRLPYEKSLAASRLGMKPETFSRALGQLKDLGIKVNGDMVEVKNIHALAQFVCSDCSACDQDCKFSGMHQCEGNRSKA
ncbi:MAG: hypothetical protein DI626_09630 [Micavibrio aeruginosavorus]|uniref:Crp/Fnr family transcriptional regulator n=1 Tax=Micavibrio aeruginosavorus TaxID=349221 RepID=A0A2W4ZQ63_9BACT|nr:MAG: hypothetical protein DI626_09630 [Micavibrio aeruginosavorus]